MWTIKKKIFIEFVTMLLLFYGGFFVCLFVCWLFGHKTCGILAPQPGIEHAPSALKGEVWTPETPGKSLLDFSVLSIFLKSRWIQKHPQK